MAISELTEKYYGRQPGGSVRQTIRHIPKEPRKEQQRPDPTKKDGLGRVPAFDDGGSKGRNVRHSPR